MSEAQEFGEDWFTYRLSFWRTMVESFKPLRILEVGSYEGRSACFMIDNCSEFGVVEICCIDTWRGGAEHATHDFKLVESKFDQNVSISIAKAKNTVHLYKRKGLSSVELSRLIADQVKKFDFIYIDGSHIASDVFFDAAAAFQLLKVGGVLVFDDYRANHTPELAHEFPKLAIDAFIIVHENKMSPISFTCPEANENTDENGIVKPGAMYQLYLEKIGD